MEYNNERDFKYTIQDTSRIYLGARMTFEDMMTWEDVPFKWKTILNHYFTNKGQDSLTETLKSLTKEDFRYQVLEQLKFKIKAGTYEEKKNLFGKVSTQYTSKMYSLGEYLTFIGEKEQVITEEFIISKLALMAFSI